MTDDADLVVALIVSARAHERDLLLLLYDGAGPDELVERLELPSTGALDGRMKRLHDRATRLREDLSRRRYGNVPPAGTMGPCST